MDIKKLVRKIRDSPGRAFSTRDGSEMTVNQAEKLNERLAKAKPGEVVKLERGETLEDVRRVAQEPELKPYTITSTIKLEATDTRAAILKASQLLAEVTHGTLYEFKEFSVKVE